MALWYRLSCALGWHARGDRREVSYDGFNYRSTCRGCGVPMVKVNGAWRVARNSVPKPPL